MKRWSRRLKRWSRSRLTERVAKLVAGVGLVGYARAAHQRAGQAATISGNRIAVDYEVEAQLVSANGHS